nr:hypothetical protein [Zavarzinella formosa]
MPRGDKSSHTAKQKRKVEHITDSYENRGVSEGEASRRAWATVKSESGGGKKSVGGGGIPTHTPPVGRAGPREKRLPQAERSAAAEKAAATRKRNAAK